MIGLPSARWILLAVALVILAAGAIALTLDDEDGGGSRAVDAAPAPAGAPNLLVVMTDDQSLSSFDRKAMPLTHELFEDGGTFFEQAIAAPPLCCPSRAGFLTGRYPHNHGVVENTVGYRSLAGKRRTFPVALQAAGYETAMIGKFLNGYEPVGGAEPAPGFDRWFSIYGYAGYTDFQVSDDGELRTEPRYATEVLTKEAIEFTAATGDDPFFLWLSYNAPHTVAPGSPPPCDGTDAQPPGAEAYERFAGEPLLRPPSFNERDVTDKPSYDAGPERLDRAEIAELTQTWRCARAALVGVDEQLARLTAALRDQGRLENTVVVYVSDNGFYFGEHRIAADKRLPMEPALRIPMAIRVGRDVARSEPPGQVPELVSQVDLAPTLADYAGVEPCTRRRCAPMDGRSLRPLLEGRGGWPEDRAIPLALDEGWTYRALRTPAELYVELSATRREEFASPVVELYDLARDPHQLENLATSRQPEVGRRLAELADRLDALSRCAGVEPGPRPPGVTTCE